MKKLSFVAAMAIAAITMTSCGGNSNAPEANLKNDVDTLSYAVGVSIGNQFTQMQVLSYQLGVDSAYVADFLRGVKESANAGDDKKKAAYYAGLQIGQQISQQIVPNVNRQFFGTDSTKTVNLNDLLSAFITLVKGDEAKFNATEADSLQKEFTNRKLNANLAAGKAFLSENAKKEGVQVTESGLQYKVLTKGDGPVPTKEDKVKVNYTGTLLDGTVFDSSEERGEPATFRADQVIKGWTEALTMMPVGSKWQLFIPQELAYGEYGNRGIEPGSTLIFTVELLEIVKE